MTIEEKLLKIRTLMQEKNIDTYLITKFDPHQSEYSSDHYNGVKFISGFSGSAGNVLITKTEAFLFVDGRYDLQAENETKGTEFKVFNISKEGTKDFFTFAKDATDKYGTISFDGKTLCYSDIINLEKMVLGKKIKIEAMVDLVGDIWENRPQKSFSTIYTLDLKYCGKDRKDKVQEVKSKMAQNDVDVYIIASLDDIAWLFNLRANDTPYNTCFESYAVLDSEKTSLFVSSEQIKDVKEMLLNDGVSIYEYEEIYPYLEQYTNEDFSLNIAFNPKAISYSVKKSLENFTITELKFNFTEELKAVKNQTELKNIEKAHVLDGVSMFRFIKWLKEEVKNGSLDEFSVSKKLAFFREQGEGFVKESFAPIVAYMANASMMHYSATANNCTKIKDSGFLLVDSGGQYYYGTTDITRTIALGDLTEQMKNDFTLVLMCHINLAKAKFLKGATGTNLDTFARSLMWQNDMDYKSGTGHGIGYFASVHEGPFAIRMGINEAKITEGMIVSNEPGVYRQNLHAIRTENILKVVSNNKNEFGEFLSFETISLCPIDLDAINVSMLEPCHKEWLNNYHANVFEALSPFLSVEESVFLKYATRRV